MSTDKDTQEEQITTREVGEKVRIKMFIEPQTIKDLGGGSFSCTVTTSDVDRTGESIDTQGIDTADYMKNPVVLYAHDYSALPIGKATKLSQFKNKMVANFQLAIAEYPFAATVAALMKGGYLNAVSIGGIVTKWSDDFKTIVGMSMLEFSVVPVPANQNALINGSSIEELTGKSIDVISKEFHDAVEKTYIDKIKGIDDNELKLYISSLEKLLAVLKANAEASHASSNHSEKEVIRLTIRKTATKISQDSQNIIKLVKKSN